MALIAVTTPEQRDLILPWRNAPEVRRVMYTRHLISDEEHRAWFEGIQADPRRCSYLHISAAGTPDGVVNFTDIDTVQRAAFWGFYTRPDAPPGTGTCILFEALDYAFGELGLYKLNAEVLDGNPASLQLHEKCGFKVEGTFRAQYFDGEQRLDVIRLGLLADEWAERRDAVCARIEQLEAMAAQPEVAPPRSIVVLSDAGSWINAMIPELMEEWGAQGHKVAWQHSPREAEAADFCFCLGLGQLVPAEVRQRFRHTLVVHGSDLPKGRGWSPLTWLILEGADRIPMTLLEAVDSVDAGRIYLQEWFSLEGHELLDEMHACQAESTRRLCRRFVDEYPRPVNDAREQTGVPSWYPRRGPEDSALDSEQPLSTQFDLLRVVDNARYPAFFEWRGHRYIVTVKKA